MQSIDLVFQVAVFSNFEEISPNAENMKFFLEKFDGQLIPNVRQMSSKSKDDSEPEDRLYLTSSDKKWIISIHVDKIDIGFVNKNLTVEEMIPISDFIEQCKNFISIVSEKFPRKFSRIGFKTESIITDVDAEGLYKKFTNPIPSFEVDNPIVWDNKSSIKKYFDSIDEYGGMSNLYGWRKGSLVVQGETKLINGFYSMIDIFTSKEINENRLSIENVTNFWNEAMKLNVDIQQELQKKIID